MAILVCVQMPSLPVVQQVQEESGLPVLTAATATARSIPVALGLEPSIPIAGAALTGEPTPMTAGGIA
jgi:maleate isomerase